MFKMEIGEDGEERYTENFWEVRDLCWEGHCLPHPSL